VTNADVVRRFEDEFKNKANLDVVDDLMASDFVHHLPYPGLQAGRAGMKDVGHLVFGAIRDITVTIDLVLSQDDLVADRISAQGVRVSDDQPTSWTENHIYRLRDGRIVELWPGGGPEIG
jgi:ketosteroid isomerase-like protein